MLEFDKKLACTVNETAVIGVFNWRSDCYFFSTQSNFDNYICYLAAGSVSYRFCAGLVNSISE
jgi:hypothetical protein